jgi:hypothetical protein
MPLPDSAISNALAAAAARVALASSSCPYQYTHRCHRERSEAISPPVGIASSLRFSQ